MSLFNFTHKNLRLALAGALTALAGGVIGAAGCGGGDAQTVAGFCQALAQQDCSYAVVQACYASTDATIETDAQSCVGVRSVTSKCNPQGLPFHPEFGDACLQAHAAAYAAAQVDASAFKAMNDACLAVFNKGGTDGAPCKGDVDCDVGNNLRCIVRVGGDGTCRLPVPTADGASCKDPSAQCGDASYCDAGFHCVQRGAQGDACGAGQPCGAGFWCNDKTKVCEAQFANTHTCNDADQCVGGFCLGVSAGGAQCAATYVFAFGGAACADFTH
jgi:hypothetical protein